MSRFEDKKIKRVAGDFARSLLYKSGLLAKSRKMDWSKVREIPCPDDMKPLYVGASNIYYIKTETTVGYLRVVSQHTTYKKCALNAVETWFTQLHPEQHVEYDSVKETIRDRKKSKLFFGMGNEDDPYSRARKFYETKDTRYVGIITPSSLIQGSEEWKNYINNIKALLSFVRSSLCRHKRNQCGGKWEFSGVNRQQATEAVAKLLGLDYMFPHSELVVVKYKDQKLFGLLMGIAEGEETWNISCDRCKSIASPRLQRDLISLNMLDVINFERDHRPGNYNIVLDDNDRVSGISVFDNDAEMTFAPFPAKYQSCRGSSCFFNKKGEINRPHLDKNVAEKLLVLKPSDIRPVLHPYLNTIQIAACISRLKKVQKAITKTMKKEKFLLGDKEWSEGTMTEELSGKYGRTYLNMFINWGNIIKAFYEYAHQMDL